MSNRLPVDEYVEPALNVGATVAAETEIKIGARMTERCLDHLIDLMPAVRRHGNEWATNFVGSIMRQAKRPSWRPSPKQLTIMRQLVHDLFAEADAGDVELIEE